MKRRGHLGALLTIYFFFSIWKQDMQENHPVFIFLLKTKQIAYSGCIFRKLNLTTIYMTQWASSKLTKGGATTPYTQIVPFKNMCQDFAVVHSSSKYPFQTCKQNIIYLRLALEAITLGPLGQHVCRILNFQAELPLASQGRFVCVNYGCFRHPTWSSSLTTLWRLIHAFTCKIIRSLNIKQRKRTSPLSCDDFFWWVYESRNRGLISLYAPNSPTGNRNVFSSLTWGRSKRIGTVHEWQQFVNAKNCRKGRKNGSNFSFLVGHSAQEYNKNKIVVIKLSQINQARSCKSHV